MWGQPKLDGLRAELAARTEAGGTSDRRAPAVRLEMRCQIENAATRHGQQSRSLRALPPRCPDTTPTHLHSLIGWASFDSIDGHCYFGSSADREYVVCGRFSLTRLEEETAPSADNLTDAGPVIDVGGDVNGDVDGDVESDD